MSEVNGKFNEIHIDLWRSYYLPSLLEKTYATILLDAKMQKL